MIAAEFAREHGRKLAMIASLLIFAASLVILKILEFTHSIDEDFQGLDIMSCLVPLATAALAGILAGVGLIGRRILRERLFLSEQRRRTIAEMNHHVRNALAVIIFHGTQASSPDSRQYVSDAVARIEWALREVLTEDWTDEDISKELTSRSAKIKLNRIVYRPIKTQPTTAGCEAEAHVHRGPWKKPN